MHLGHLVSFGIGGADRAAFHLALGLRELGVEQTILYTDMSIPSASRITNDQDPSAPVHSIRSQYLQEGFKLVRIKHASDLETLDIDLIQTHRSGEDSWLLPGLEEVEVSVPICETNFHGILKSRASVRVFPSRALMSAKNISQSHNHLVIPNPVTERLSLLDFREEYGLENNLVFGRVGRADRSIYSPKLLLCHKIISRQFPEAVLLWVGASRRARRDANLLGVRNVIWIEPIESQEVLSKFYNTMDVFCHVNRLGETFGNTIAEAMMHGLPIVSLRGSRNYPQAQAEVLGGDNFVLSNVWSFTQSLKRFASSPSFRSQVGSANEQRAKAIFGRNNIATQYLELYSSLLEH